MEETYIKEDGCLPFPSDLLDLSSSVNMGKNRKII